MRAGLSQEDVALRMGTSQSAIARLESRHKPSLRSLERFAEATGSRLVVRLEARSDCDASLSDSHAPTGWLRTSETDDLLDSLEHCAKSLEAATADPKQWKWAIISMHSALQAAMICHLTGSAGLGALERKCVKKMLAWHDRDGAGEIEWEDVRDDDIGLPGKKLTTASDAPPAERLANYMTLYDRLVGHEQRIERAAESVISDSPERRRIVKRLNLLRNRLTNYAPAAWSIELAGLPSWFTEYVSILSEIAQSPWPFRHTDGAWRTQLNTLLEDIAERCNALATFYTDDLDVPRAASA